MDASSLPHAWTEDTRTPIVQFSFHGSSYGLYLLSIPMWIELVCFIVANASLAALFSIVLYFVVVRNPSTKLAYLTGFGLFLPFWIFAPKVLCSFCDLQNKIFSFCVCVVTPNVSIFRITEAIFGFTPEYAKKSLSSFALYFASPMYLVYDKKSDKFLKVGWTKVLWHLQRFVGFLIFTGLLQSLFTLSSFFPSYGQGTPSNWYHISEIFNPVMWKSSILYAILFQFYLATFGEGLSFVTTLITRRQVVAMMNNPIFGSNSPAEFWGRRWNSLIHTCLKNGVYKPVRKLGGSREMAVLASFVASGLFHEWILPVVIFDHDGPVPGTTSLFFVWQAMLISLEYTVGHWKIVSNITKSLPGLVKTGLVILSGAPLGHWFCDGYVNSNFFVHGHIGLMALLPLKDE
ncbi:hypothetical protein ACA910_003790 [Epithemia clementina (nom. ined.)]